MYNDLCRPGKLIGKEKMLQTFDNKQEWLDNRGIVTASKIGAIVGHSPYSTPKQQWEYATGRKKEYFSEKSLEHMERGNEDEATVLAIIHDKLVYNYNSEVGWEDHYVDQAFFKQDDKSATLDRFYTVKKINVEVKSTSQKWGNLPPLMYIDQMYFQSGLSESEHNVLGWVEQRFFDNIHTLVIKPDDGYQNFLFDQAEKFIFCVKEDIPFEPDYYRHPYADEWLENYDNVNDQKKFVERFNKEIGFLLGEPVQTSSGVWQFDFTEKKAYGYSATKLKEVFSDSKDLLESCRNNSSVSKTIVFIPNENEE
jgi:hypothetical protein